MHITLIEPFFTGSHRRWAESFQKYSKHQVEILSLSGRHWKWRMFGAAVSLAKIYQQKIKHTDLILASDMLDLSTFLGLTRKVTHQIPTALYFHENQLTYPWSPTDQDVKNGRSNEYAFLNYTSALAADYILFNSNYHLTSFVENLPSFLKRFPDHQEKSNVSIIKNKSKVLHLGMDLQSFDDYEPNISNKATILWNHRWEYDKNPTGFFNLLFKLAAANIDFNLIVLGEKYSRYPSIFDEAQRILSDRILQFGYAPNFETYARWIKTADLLPVTSHQDFFGGSIVEAMYCNVTPLLPHRLAYPEHIKDDYFLYHNEDELFEKTKTLLCMKKENKQINFSNWVHQYDWKSIISSYDKSLDRMKLV